MNKFDMLLIMNWRLDLLLSNWYSAMRGGYWNYIIASVLRSVCGGNYSLVHKRKPCCVDKNCGGPSSSSSLRLLRSAPGCFSHQYGWFHVTSHRNSRGRPLRNPCTTCSIYLRPLYCLRRLQCSSCACECECAPLKYQKIT